MATWSSKRHHRGFVVAAANGAVVLNSQKEICMQNCASHFLTHDNLAEACLTVAHTPSLIVGMHCGQVPPSEFICGVGFISLQVD